MRSRSSLWKQIVADGHFSLATIAVINGKNYSTITAPIITRSIFQNGAVSVGNCVSARLEFTVMTTDTIDRAAEIYITYQPFKDGTYAEPMSIGPFFINERKVNDEFIDLICYDSMLKCNQPYVDDSTTLNWPKPMRTVVQRCAEIVGIELESGTLNKIKNTAEYVVTMPSATTTILEILGHIAAVHGANWIVTDEGKLRLVNLVTAPLQPSTWTEESGTTITNESSVEIEFKPTEDDSETSANTVNVPIVIGSLSTGKPLFITRVTMEYDSEIGWSYGDSEGYEIIIANNPYVTQAMCDELWHELNGMMIVPYSIENAIYDPASELGDYCVVGNSFASILAQETRTFDIGFSADANIQGEEEIDLEYGYVGDLQKIKQENNRLYKYAQNVGRTLDSKIVQTRTEIELSVQETYTPKADAITFEQMYYYKSSSPTELYDGEWTDNAPRWEDGWYIWVKLRYIKGDGTYTESEPVCASGSPGLAGEPGAPGTNTYFHIKYSAIENPQVAGDMTETPSLYIGTYVDSLPGDSANPADYTWARFQGYDGKDGIPGVNGKDGTTQYFHIKYSNDGGNTFTPDDGEVVGIFIGTLVDFTKQDSTNPADYTWAKFQGEDGKSVTILGSYDTYEQLIAAHPTGQSGDGYLVDGDLFVWDGTQWVDVGRVQGPAGADGRDALYLYITSDRSTMTPFDVAATVTLTACVGRGDDGDIDPDGTKYFYSWYISVDGGEERFFAGTKQITVSIDSDLCNDRASVRFALVQGEYLQLTNENSVAITDEIGTALEVA